MTGEIVKRIGDSLGVVEDLDLPKHSLDGVFFQELMFVWILPNCCQG